MGRCNTGAIRSPMSIVLILNSEIQSIIIVRMYTVSGKKETPSDIGRGSFFSRHSVENLLTPHYNTVNAVVSRVDRFFMWVGDSYVDIDVCCDS